VTPLEAYGVVSACVGLLVGVGFGYLWGRLSEQARWARRR